MNRKRTPKKVTQKPISNVVPNDPQSLPGNPVGRELRIISAHSKFSGPIPPPSILAGYNDIIPDGAERIFRMAEKQQDHRMELERITIVGDTNRSKLGLILGFVLSVLVVFGGVYIIAIGRDISGLVLIFVPLGTLVTVFINTQAGRERERSKQKKDVTHQDDTEEEL